MKCCLLDLGPILREMIAGRMPGTGYVPGEQERQRLARPESLQSVLILFCPEVFSLACGMMLGRPSSLKGCFRESIWIRPFCRYSTKVQYLFSAGCYRLHLALRDGCCNPLPAWSSRLLAKTNCGDSWKPSPGRDSLCSPRDPFAAACVWHRDIKENAGCSGIDGTSSRVT